MGWAEGEEDPCDILSSLQLQGGPQSLQIFWDLHIVLNSPKPATSVIFHPCELSIEQIAVANFLKYLTL
jgi:hypothetical protein